MPPLQFHVCMIGNDGLITALATVRGARGV